MLEFYGVAIANDYIVPRSLEVHITIITNK
uniref:Uncharacterized protein n=1 Tax=Anguilla anguilla TaxID=7936 RepID=A0A0E9TUP7_ANGAN